MNKIGLHVEDFGEQQELYTDAQFASWTQGLQDNLPPSPRMTSAPPLQQVPYVPQIQQMPHGSDTKEV